VTWLGYPWRPALGQTRLRDDPGHVRDMLELVLFTSPGERVNRPDFGCGLAQLVFDGNSPELAMSVDLAVRGAVQRWLSDVLTLEDLQVTSEDATLTVELSYRLRATGEPGRATLTRAAS
jgi:phage baseplate assembly protein W